MKYLTLLRVNNYIKNVIILVPVFFSGTLFMDNNLYIMLLSFICFSFITSTVYIINDIHDKESDCNHYRKKNRPIASNQISITFGYLICIILLLISSLLLILLKLPYISLIFIYSYLFINILYTYILKNIPYLDIFIIILNFIIRILYGASILSIKISLLLYITIINLALYLIIGKRRGEIIKNGIKARKVLKYYNNKIFDRLMIISLLLTIISYFIWVITKKFLLIITLPIVIFALIRYNKNVFRNSYDDPIEIITNDYLIFALFIFWIIVVTLILY